MGSVVATAVAPESERDLIHAHDGAMLLDYSAAPTAVEVPSECTVMAELGGGSKF